MDATQDRKTRRLICLALAFFTVLTYWRVIHNGFINYDDDVYVTDNPHVNGGLSFSGIIWAFTHFYAANWHPLTWISHMMDCQLFGLRPGPQHIVNVGLHTANAVLLFLLLSRMTRALWRSAMVAALFALHPIHVESVAWIAERKDLLCAFFGLLALLAYVRFVELSREQNPKVGVWYGIALVMFACGLMSKPMLVTLPFVMLLLDLWPLNRISNIRSDQLKSAIVEKWPFFVLTMVLCIVTYCAQKSGGAITSAEYPMGFRIANASVSYLDYIERTLWPGKLSVIYPLAPIPFVQIAISVAVLLLISSLCVMAAKRRMYLLTGWLWYLGTLVPVIGLVQVGRQSSADRYTYLPLIGLFLIIVWGAADLLKALKIHKFVAVFVSGLILLSCAVDTTFQLQFWKNGIRLFDRALAVTTDNALAQNDFAAALVATGYAPVALAHYAEAARLAPDDAVMQNNYGVALARDGQINAAIAGYENAIRLQTNYADAYNNLGSALAGNGRFDEAATALSQAVALDPDNAGVHFNFGIALLRLGRVPEAAQEFATAVKLDSAMSQAQYQYGLCLAMMRRPQAAIGHLQEAARLQPDWVEPLNALAWILATDGDARVRNGPEAVIVAENAATKSQWQQPAVLNTLAAAYAEAGRFDDATNTAGKAIGLAQKMGQSNLVAQIQPLLALYQQHQAFHHP